MQPHLEVLPLGAVDTSVLKGVSARLEKHGFDTRVIEPGPAARALVAPGAARLQALMVLPQLRNERGDHVLALTELELTDGVSPQVFGMGEINGRAAVFSAAPFRRGGLSGDTFLDRLTAAILHELAHNVGMVHCRTKGCLMHATHEPAAMRQLELAFCATCARSWRRRIRAAPEPPASHTR